MLNELLNLSIKDRNKIISGLSSETKKHIFNSIYTMTEELALDKVKDFSKRVQMRAKLIEQFPDTVFWDYGEYCLGDELIQFNNTLISTTGILVTLTIQNQLKIVVSSKCKENNYVGFTKSSKPKISGKLHRCSAMTYIPIPEKLKGIPYSELQINHKDKVRNNNDTSNLEWVTARENSKHKHGIKNYLEEEYFLFEVLVDNGFKGRKFVIECYELIPYKLDGGILRSISKGNYRQKWYGMRITNINIKEIHQYERGFPEDIKALWLKNKIYFSIGCKPVIGTVLVGRYKGVKFSLMGEGEAKKYFNYGNVQACTYGLRGAVLGCSFIRGTIREALPYHGKLTSEILESLNRHKRISKKDKENK